jgi:hypothetical protein
MLDTGYAAGSRSAACRASAKVAFKAVAGSSSALIVLLVSVLTCFRVKKYTLGTAGQQRGMLQRHQRYYRCATHYHKV